MRQSVNPAQTADLLHSAAIKLLRRLRTSDSDAGLTSGQASVISVLVYAGAKTISELAAIEQVALPTMSRLIREMEKARLIQRTPHESDARSSVIAATQKSRALLDRARALRLGRLEKAVSSRNAAERKLLHQAAETILALAKNLD